MKSSEVHSIMPSASRQRSRFYKKSSLAADPPLAEDWIDQLTWLVLTFRCMLDTMTNAENILILSSRAAMLLNSIINNIL
jgi:hypothetical protein